MKNINIANHLAAGLIASLTLYLNACASLSTQLPEIQTADLMAEQMKQEQALFKDLVAHTARLNNVASLILVKNADLCEKTTAVIGIKTHTLKNYPKTLRNAANRELGASEIPQIIYVEPNSPADKAGLKIGDILIDAAGNPVGHYKKALIPLDETGSGSPQDKLTYKRDSARYTTRVSPIMSCNYKVRLSSSAAINAYANGQQITVTTGMLDFVETDSELAVIIGHELAHNTLGHIRKIVGNLILSGFNTRYTRPFESEADYVGLYYTDRAGFDIDNVEDIWRRLARISTKSITRAKSHPTYSNRYLILAATRKEIENKRASGVAVLPNFIHKNN